MPDEFIRQGGDPALYEHAEPVTSFDVNGDSTEVEYEGFAASLMQHEIDHLDGMLTLQRADPAERHRAITALLSGGPGLEHRAA